MGYHSFKTYVKTCVKYVLFFIFLINLVSTAHADTGRLVHYNWTEDNGNTIIDNSGHGNDGINNGTTTFILSTGGTARHFNGQSRITIPNNDQLAFTDPHITFGVFFRYNSSNPARNTYLVSKGNTAFRISIDHTNSMLTYSVYADGHPIHASSGTRIQPNKDYEAIVTYNGSHAQLYINGLANGRGVDYAAEALGPSYITENWTIGSSSDNTYGLNGTVYAFHLYNRTLNSSEILDLYANDLRSIQHLRPGGIALSWDDSGHIQSCYRYLDIFQKYNATCTINVNAVSTRAEAARELEELEALYSAGWEVALHGYNHKDSVRFLSNNTPATWLDQEIFPNIVEITRYGYPIYTFAYPYSSRNAVTDATIAPYFRTLRTRTPTLVNGNINETTGAYYNWDDTQLLYGVEIDDQAVGANLQSIENGIDYAIKTGSVLVLFGHAITPNVTGPYQISTARLESILNYTSQNGGVFYHMGDLGNSSWKQVPRFSNVTANFTVSANSIFAGENVTFTDYSINHTTGLLDFGDDSPASSVTNITHTYISPGIYTANLMVSNDVSTDFMLKKITVVQAAAPVPDFTSDCTTGPRPLTVTFNDASTGLPATWSWDFGDGNKSASQNPTHEYSKAGNYSVTLTAANSIGSNSIKKVDYITVLPQPPSSDFCSNVTNGVIPLTVQFNDTSTGSPAAWKWDFGDGNVSSEQNPVHTYFSAGTYNVNLTVNNIDRSSSKTATITAFGSDSSGGGRSSSGGGGGGSPEPAKNIKVKELSQAYVAGGKPVRFEFPKNVTAIVYLSFDAKKTAGRTTAIVEMLRDKSTLTPYIPEGEVCDYLNIWVGNGGYGSDEENLENAVICFKVDKSWIQEKGVDKTSITLNRYDDKKWSELPATLLREDNRYLYFTTETPGFSPFAITGKLTAKENLFEILPEPETENPEYHTPNIAADVGHAPGKKEKITGIPGFEWTYCIIGLLAGFGV
ncbi:MAG: PGF-pre-PGF domain-containing protein [Methanosarcina flavescens]|jgi:PGF-pre-PGF domain-containing protein|uniref:PGF-pre-PGF domain-containing protein n=1 Tax=Methanosarcina flavescens TaxID=1715806 RepID=A0A660HUW7_9EURY|nr:PGF-pre-PGF domain-containing protein [Methanosarcina flavescens]AYK16083.1 PGF-pre-PGF domain-containing protein [Methanosarcina flavescens]NLK32233.1 PGF-pre-PGF domain-containing protein [Methanosarcina flavescens]